METSILKRKKGETAKYYSGTFKMYKYKNVSHITGHVKVFLLMLVSMFIWHLSLPEAPALVEVTDYTA